MQGSPLQSQTLVENQQLRGQCIFEHSLEMHANLEKLDLLMLLFI